MGSGALALPHGRKLLEMQSFRSTTSSVGYGFGIFSGLFYVGSRIPQIVKNFKRKRTEGLSMMLFVQAVLGNLTYSLAVLMMMDGIHKEEGKWRSDDPNVFCDGKN